MPYKIDEIMAIADKYGIPVVEDAAEGMGSRFNGQVLGTFYVSDEDVRYIVECIKEAIDA